MGGNDGRWQIFKVELTADKERELFSIRSMRSGKGPLLALGCSPFKNKLEPFICNSAANGSYLEIQMPKCKSDYATR